MIYRWKTPFNIYQIHGTLCCPTMGREYEKIELTRYWSCYEAKVIYEANVLLIWGSISLKLSGLLINGLENMMGKRSLIHIKGCALRVNNTYTLSSLKDILPIDLEISECSLKKSDYSAILSEAQKCLRA